MKTFLLSPLLTPHLHHYHSANCRKKLQPNAVAKLLGTYACCPEPAAAQGTARVNQRSGSGDGALHAAGTSEASPRLQAPSLGTTASWLPGHMSQPPGNPLLLPPAWLLSTSYNHHYWGRLIIRLHKYGCLNTPILKYSTVFAPIKIPVDLIAFYIDYSITGVLQEHRQHSSSGGKNWYWLPTSSTRLSKTENYYEQD